MPVSYPSNHGSGTRDAAHFAASRPQPSSPWCSPGAASRPLRHPEDKARRLRISGNIRWRSNAGIGDASPVECRRDLHHGLLGTTHVSHVPEVYAMRLSSGWTLVALESWAQPFIDGRGFSR